MAKRTKKEAAPSEPTCRVCGCTEAAGCPPDGCSWVSYDLCSACKEIMDEIAPTLDEQAKAWSADKTARFKYRKAFRAGAEAAIRAYRARVYAGLDY